MALEKFLRDLPSSISSPKSFKIPPLDGSLTLPEIYDWHFVHNPNKTVFVYESDPAEGYTHITYREVIPASHRAATWIASRMSVELNYHGMNTVPPVAIIATTDTITHFCVQLGLLKAGISYIAITPRTSPAVVAYLADKVGVEFVFHSSEPAVVALAEESSEHMNRHYSRPLHYFAMPEYRNIFYDGVWPILKERKYELEFPAIYSHSSGSTGAFPKPIPWTHAFILQLAMAPLFGDVDFCDEVIAYHSASMSHGSGKHLLPFIPSSGMVIAVFPPCAPAKFPSPEATYQAFAKVKPDYVWVFPNLLESWSIDPGKVATLKTVKRAIFVGSMLNKDVGDYLAKCGVQIYPLYGMAEAGVLARFMPPPQGLDWEYFPLTAHSNAHFIDRGDNLYELFLVEHQFKRLYLSNTTLDGAKAYATRDAFMEHPSKSGYWKVCGRLDDRIVHPTGEKTDPVPMEHIMDRDAQVKSTIVFGNGRAQCGVLFQLEAPHVFDPTDQRMLAAFRQYIMPRVEAANKVAPTYSRIYPEMILVASSQKPFMYTEKGSLKRKEILKAYMPEIDSLYNQLEEDVGLKIIFPENRELSQIVNFVQRVLKTLPLNVPEDEDVFRYGCSSLQATRIEIMIRNSLELVLNSHSAVKHIRNFVYEYQTPRGIAQYLISTFDKAAATASTPRIKDMEQSIDSLSANFPFFEERVAETEDSVSENIVVLITGTTGALGSNLLSTLLNDSTVHQIYALNRSNRVRNLAERQRDVFLEQGLDPESITSSKIKLFESDLTQPHFGLDLCTFEKMRQSVTHIYHLAWDVNWLVRLPSFRDLLEGLRKLIDFALSSHRPRPPAFIYASSIGVFHNVSTGGTMREVSLEELAYADGQGYAESKAIAERVLEAAGNQTLLRPSIVRFGQISGGTSGAWTTKEWFPTILRSSITIGRLPELQGVVSFIPVDRAAKVLNELRDAHAPFLHLVNPRSTPFGEILEFCSRELSLPLVPYHDWVQTVEQAESKCASSPELLALIPASKILDFFRERLSKSGLEALGYPSLETSIAQSLSQALRDIPPTGVEEAEKWLGHWKRIQFL